MTDAERFALRMLAEMFGFRAAVTLALSRREAHPHYLSAVTPVRMAILDAIVRMDTTVTVTFSDADSKFVFNFLNAFKELSCEKRKVEAGFECTVRWEEKDIEALADARSANSHLWSRYFTELAGSYAQLTLAAPGMVPGVVPSAPKSE